MNFRVHIHIVALCLIMSAYLFSCYEPEEGCLDSDASNYDVSADYACDDCCELPRFNLLISYLYKGESYSFGIDTIETSVSSMIIDDFHFILSDISLVDPRGNELNWDDTFEIYTNGLVTDTVENDIRYFSRTSFRGTLNELRYGGIISRLQFSIGLNPEINLYNKDSLDINTGLNIVPDEAYSEDDGFQFFSFSTKDLNGNESIYIASKRYPLPEVLLDLTSFEIAKGFDSELNVFIDFGLLFDGINIEMMTENEVIEKLMTNFSKSFGER